MHHLDTNIAVAYLNGDQRISKQLKFHVPNVAVSSLVLAELLFGARTSARVAENLSRIHKFLQVIEVVPFDQICAEAYSTLRLQLKQRGQPTGGMDALIASVAIANNAILVTHNTRHFANIDDLTIDDWIK
jgi:tRNA(fMet)-specific endonuclease VapC